MKAACTEASGYLEMISLILMKITDSKKGINNDYDRTYETSSSTSEPHLLAPENLNELFRDVNLSKKNKLNSYVSDKKRGIISTKIMNYVSFIIVKMNSKNFP